MAHCSDPITIIILMVKHLKSFIYVSHTRDTGDAVVNKTGAIPAKVNAKTKPIYGREQSDSTTPRLRGQGTLIAAH